MLNLSVSDLKESPAAPQRLLCAEIPGNVTEGRQKLIQISARPCKAP
jgi:hypothetical protein